MSDNVIQEYLVHYLPSLIGKLLAEKPIPDMTGTSFSLQVTIEGEKNLTFGITIKNAADITVTTGEINNPMISLNVPEAVIKPLVAMVSSFTGRGRYDIVKDTKGSMEVEIDMPGGWTLPVRTVFNGVREPRFKLNGTLGDLSQMATGDIDPTRAFMQGKLKIEGDLAFALSLSRLSPGK
jgi:hypothetical protein